MNDKQVDYAVVGAGIVGLVSALYLAEQGYSVVLIEASGKTGGLLGKAYSWNQLSFDYGTHFISNTGIDAIDAFLFEADMEQVPGWIKVPILKAGNYFAGELNEQSPSLNLKALPDADYLNCCVDLLHLDSPHSEFANLADRIQQTMGNTVTETVFRPMMQKLYQQDLENLDANAHHLFSLSRLILGSEFITGQLKTADFFDNVVSFQHRSQGASSLKTYYHVEGICGWVNYIEQRLAARDNFALKLDHKITGLTEADGVMQLAFQDQPAISCKKLIWTAPLFLLARLLGISLSGKTQVRSVELLHFVVDKPFLTDLHYFYNYDPDYKSFRVTLYSNIIAASTGQYHCTVEVLKNNADEDINAADILAELIKMQVIDPSAAIIHQNQQSIKNGFPVKDTQFGDNAIRNAELIQQNQPHICLMGRNAGKSFFMKDVIIDCINSMEELVNDGI